ncbi:MAG: hypothetical protein COB02_11105 [Candidatus Cloacimonadota bacterium]|nr:MAG: hypothetical protein COB02_11105 [Candidatus Cloacimonadota bacterium]
MYFDYNATHPICVEIENNFKKLIESDGNPSSAHKIGRTAKDAMESVREKIADYLGVSYKEIFFTSGGTESNVLALLGYCDKNLKSGNKILYLGVEHPSLLGAIKNLSEKGFHCVKIAVDSNGLPDMNEFSKEVVDASFVTMMYVNNETGLIFPIDKVAKLCKENNVVFHSDCVQAFTKIKMDFTNIDLASFSGHKIGSFKGVGFLYKKSSISLAPLFPYSTQEKGVRGGTENTIGINSLGIALESIFHKNKIKELRDFFESEILKRLNNVSITCFEQNRVDNTSNINFRGCSGESLMFSLDIKNICVSLGSACAAGSITPSHVLLEMGFSDKKARSTLRFSFGRYNTKDEVVALLDILEEIVNRIKK